MEVLKCKSCQKELTADMEIEYSQTLTEYFCNPDCAQDHYFDYMMSSPVDLTDKDDLKDRDIVIKDGKLYDTSY